MASSKDNIQSKINGLSLHEVDLQSQDQQEPHVIIHQHEDDDDIYSEELQKALALSTALNNAQNNDTQTPKAETHKNVTQAETPKEAPKTETPKASTDASKDFSKQNQSPNHSNSIVQTSANLTERKEKEEKRKSEKDKESTVKNKSDLIEFPKGINFHHIPPLTLRYWWTDQGFIELNTQVEFSGIQAAIETSADFQKDKQKDHEIFTKIRDFIQSHKAKGLEAEHILTALPELKKSEFLSKMQNMKLFENKVKFWTWLYEKEAEIQKTGISGSKHTQKGKENNGDGLDAATRQAMKASLKEATRESKYANEEEQIRQTILMSQGLATDKPTFRGAVENKGEKERKTISEQQRKPIEKPKSSGEKSSTNNNGNNASKAQAQPITKPIKPRTIDEEITEIFDKIERLNKTIGPIEKDLENKQKTFLAAKEKHKEFFAKKFAEFQAYQEEAKNELIHLLEKLDNNEILSLGINELRQLGKSELISLGIKQEVVGQIFNREDLFEENHDINTFARGKINKTKEAFDKYLNAVLSFQKAQHSAQTQIFNPHKEIENNLKKKREQIETMKSDLIESETRLLHLFEKKEREIADKKLFEDLKKQKENGTQTSLGLSLSKDESPKTNSNIQQKDQKPVEAQMPIVSSQEAISLTLEFVKHVQAEAKKKEEQAKPEQVKAEQPKAEEPKPEQVKAEQPKAEEPKVETPKAEQSKTETQKNSFGFKFEVDEISLKAMQKAATIQQRARQQQSFPEFNKNEWDKKMQEEAKIRNEIVERQRKKRQEELNSLAAYSQYTSYRPVATPSQTAAPNQNQAVSNEQQVRTNLENQNQNKP